MFKLHHIQSAVSCITGVQIHPFQITNTMMGTECPVSLAFEGDKVVVVNNGQVVFYTTTKGYADEVQKFLDITRSLRNTRKDVKGMEKQLKAYSAPDLASGDTIPALLVKQLDASLPAEVKVMREGNGTIDLDLVKKGDTVFLRKGSELTIAAVDSNCDCTDLLQYCITFTNNNYSYYRQDGCFAPNGRENQSDIVKVICN